MAKNGMCLSECISKTVIAMGNLKTDLKSSLNYLSGVSPPFFTYGNPYRGNFEFKNVPKMFLQENLTKIALKFKKIRGLK